MDKPIKKNSRWKYVLLLIVSLGFVIVGIRMVNKGEWFGWFGILFFGSGIPILIWQMVNSRPEPTIGEEGVLDQAPDYRTTAEIEASFRSLERRLDAMLDEARHVLEHERIALHDASNRSGFGGGFPYFVWGFRFVRQEPFRSEIKRATVRLNYLEPALEGESRRIEVTFNAEIFQIGKHSRVTEGGKTVYEIEQFLNMRMDQVVMDFIAAAEQILAKQK